MILFNINRIKPARYLVPLLFALFAIEVQANDTVIIHKDARLELLSAKQAQINKRTSMMTSGGQYKGFRLQVISTTGRDRAQSVKTDLMNKFPEQKSYLLFQSPYFKVRIGNFVKKEDANNFRKQLSRYFPQGVYIVEDAIEYVPGDEDFF